MSIAIALVALALPPAVSAQSGVRGANTSDRIERLLFSPEMVMRQQRELGLTGDQKDTLISEMQQAQSDLVPLQLEMAEIGGDLARLLSQPRVDEDAAVAAAGRVMDLESRIKTRHLVLLVRIRNMLSLEQQGMLRRVRRRQWEQRRNGGER
ncbi:MAG: periplasmic heavy metal sensor [Thermoanaerobaculia bacterium]